MAQRVRQQGRSRLRGGTGGQHPEHALQELRTKVETLLRRREGPEERELPAACKERLQSAFKDKPLRAPAAELLQLSVEEVFADFAPRLKAP